MEINCSVLKGAEVLYKSEGYDDDIKNPVKISITIDEKQYLEIKEIADYYKWSLDEAISELLTQNPRETIEKGEMKAQGLI